MKRTMYQAARHTPKRNVVSSSLAGGARNTAVSQSKRLAAVFFRLSAAARDCPCVAHHQKYKTTLAPIQKDRSKGGERLPYSLNTRIALSVPTIDMVTSR